MKTVLNPAYNPSFVPGAPGVGTLNFSSYNSIFGFSINRLIAVINLTQGVIIYADSLAGFTMNAWNGTTNVLTLNANTTGFNSTDLLEVVYDDPQATVSLAPPTIIGGWTGRHHNVLSSTTNLTVVKSSPGVIGSLAVSGMNSNNICFVKVFDKATAPILGTDTPVFSLSSFNNYYGFFPIPMQGVKFLNGIAYAVTGNPADTDATAISISTSTPILDMLYV